MHDVAPLPRPLIPTQERNLELAARLGADYTHETTVGELPEGTAEALRQGAGAPEGFDVVIDCAGFNATMLVGGGQRRPWLLTRDVLLEGGTAWNLQSWQQECPRLCRNILRCALLCHADCHPRRALWRAHRAGGCLGVGPCQRCCC